MKFYKTDYKLKASAKGFEETWNFPNCLGAVNGKHICITPLADSGSEFWNYKCFSSLELLAICSAN
jgi:hypothetical protein